jgi:hypothetical protein
MDGAAVEEELIGEGRLAGVRVTDDRKGAAALGFASELGVRLGGQEGRGREVGGGL